MHPTQPEQSEFARLLAGIQERGHLSYQQVADAAGVNRSQAWRWVKAGSAPGYEHVRRLAAHLVTEYPQLADDAARLLPAAGYQTPLVSAEPPAESTPVPEPSRETPALGDDVKPAVVAALYGPAERRIWAHVREHLAGTPAGRALFADPGEVAAWPPEAPDGLSGGAPFKMTPEARALLDAIPAAGLFTDPYEVIIWNLDKLQYRKRVSMIREYREPVREPARPPRAVRRAGLKKPSTLSALSS